MASSDAIDEPTFVTAPVAGSIRTRAVGGGLPAPTFKPYRIDPSNSSAPYPPPAGLSGLVMFVYRPLVELYVP